MGDLTTTIIVPTINARPDLLTVCISEIERTLRHGDCYLVVEGGTFAENCNAGVAVTETDTVIFLNDDTKPDDDAWIDSLLQPFADLRVGIVGARLIYPTGQLQHTGVYFDNDATGIVAHNRVWDSPSGPVDAVTGACMAVRTSVFREQNGFDAAYRNGYEDIDFCLRARQAGHMIWYTSDCTVIHHESQSGAARWQYTPQNVARLQDSYSLTATPAD